MGNEKDISEQVRSASGAPEKPAEPKTMGGRVFAHFKTGATGLAAKMTADELKRAEKVCDGLVEIVPAYALGGESAKANAGKLRALKDQTDNLNPKIVRHLWDAYSAVFGEAQKAVVAALAAE